MPPGSRLNPNELLGELRRADRLGVPTWLASAFAGSIEELERALASKIEGPSLDEIRARASTLLELYRPATARDDTPPVEIDLRDRVGRSAKGRRPPDR